MNFQKWLKGFEVEYEKKLKEWQAKSSYKSLIPEGLRERLIQQYSAYRNEMETKRLVLATWTLAIVTIVLSIISLILR